MGEKKEIHVDYSIVEYRTLILEMVGKINNKRFMKAIYISISDFLQETEKEEKPE